MFFGYCSDIEVDLLSDHPFINLVTDAIPEGHIADGDGEKIVFILETDEVVRELIEIVHGKLPVVISGLYSRDRVL